MKIQIKLYRNLFVIVLSLLTNIVFAYKIEIDLSGISTKFGFKFATYRDSIIYRKKDNAFGTFFIQIETEKQNNVLSLYFKNKQKINIDFNEIMSEVWMCQPTCLRLKKQKRKTISSTFIFCEIYNRVSWLTFKKQVRK